MKKANSHLRVSATLITKSEEFLSKRGLVRTASSQPGSGGLRLLMDTTVVQVYNDVSPDGPQVSREAGWGSVARGGTWLEGSCVQAPHCEPALLGRNSGQTFLVFLKKFTMTFVALLLLSRILRLRKL